MFLEQKSTFFLHEAYEHNSISQTSSLFVILAVEHNFVYKKTFFTRSIFLKINFFKFFRKSFVLSLEHTLYSQKNVF